MILKVEFDEQAWQRVIDMLALAPYRDAAPFIAAIAQQFQQQREKGNGSMATDGQALPERDAARTNDTVGSRRN